MQRRARLAFDHEDVRPRLGRRVVMLFDAMGRLLERQALRGRAIDGLTQDTWTKRVDGARHRHGGRVTDLREMFGEPEGGIGLPMSVVGIEPRSTS